ncbi:cellular nucleic acid-binding protein homolog [Vicia villosa]|uniref:cellular nucleic acid-binding protein homolog n=1 Tax=Vicia villosa TaxID=3911 RepID=UPI00273A8F87|nr:cellular nucleic acid-binding protein homolog [Vicia villosa]
MNEKKGKFRGKPYDGKGKQKNGNGKRPNGGGSHIPVKCYRSGVEGHRISEGPRSNATCFKCGKVGHKSHECRGGSKVTCYNYGEQCHISTKCDKPKKDQLKGKVFALSCTEFTTDDRLIQGSDFSVDPSKIEDIS